MGQLVADGAGDLGAQQLAVVAEVALEGVAVDDDPVGVVVAGDRVADVVAVGAVLAAVAETTTGVVSNRSRNSAGRSSMAWVTSSSNSSGGSSGTGRRASASLRSTMRSNCCSLGPSSPIIATNTHAVIRISAAAPPIHMAMPGRPDSDGGSIRNSTTPTVNAATSAAFSGARA